MFSHVPQYDPRFPGTPTKKRKLNQFSTYDDQNGLQLQLNRKKSLIDCFQFIGAINRRDSTKLQLLRKQSISRQNICVSAWDMPEPAEPKQQRKVTSLQMMDVEQPRPETDSQSSENEPPQQFKFVKRATMVAIRQQDAFPRLYRCNSNIEIDQQINEAQERKYGDNIYMDQMYSMGRRNTKISSKNSKNEGFNRRHGEFDNRKNFEQSDEEYDAQDRLLKDYEISSSIHAYVKNHQNYLCLNKLERIFYYVKKINFDDEEREEEIEHLCQSQIRLYNRDDEGRLLRFYQSWEEDDCIYMVFETVSTSLQEKLISGIKLRQNEVWSLLSDCSQALAWMKESGEWHLNIKPGNMLKCRDRFKLADPFITPEILAVALTMFKGEHDEEEKLKLAFAYSAPQILQYRNFMTGLAFQKCDIYSIGLCILQNLTGIPVNMLKRDLPSIRKNNQKYLRGYSHALRTTIVKMVSIDPTKRPKVEQISGLRQLEQFDCNYRNKREEGKLAAGKLARKMSC